VSLRKWLVKNSLLSFLFKLAFLEMNLLLVRGIYQLVMSHSSRCPNDVHFPLFKSLNKSDINWPILFVFMSCLILEIDIQITITIDAPLVMGIGTENSPKLKL